MEYTTPFSQLHGYLALVFMCYWAITLVPATKSWAAYKKRTVVILIYALFSMADHHKVPSNFEWMADGLVWSHFISFVTIFVYGDPRLREHKHAR